MLDDRLLELLARWEEARQSGRTLTPVTLCPDDTLLRIELQKRIDKRLQLERDFDLPISTIGLADRDFSEDDPWPVIDGYNIVEVLGRGGTGTVYRAFDQRLQREVALKVLHPAVTTARSRDRLQLEASAVARLQHPNIVQIFAIGESHERMYLALELINGGSLSVQIGGTPWHPRRAAELIRALAIAIAHAHENGIVHRDLKPGNILMTREGVPKVADFGLAKNLDDDLRLTQTGTIIGTPSYMAPEQAAGRIDQIGPATDIHALGAMLYELLTGKVPFEGSSLLETLEHVRLREPIPLLDAQANLPRDIATICHKCLEKVAGRRYATARALADDLQRFLDGDSITARDSTFFDHMVRSVGHITIDPAMSRLSQTAIRVSPFPFLMHMLTFVFCRKWPSYPLLSIAVTMLTISSLLALLLLGNRRFLLRVRSDQRRHISSVWLSHLIAFVLSPCILWFSGLVKTPSDWMILYPMWLTNVGTVFFAIASQAGPMYLLGSACFATALLAAMTPTLAPLEVGALISLNLLAQGLVLRHVGRDKAPSLTAQQRSDNSALAPDSGHRHA